MDTETIWSEAGLRAIRKGVQGSSSHMDHDQRLLHMAREVLHSPEIKRLREDAERYQWLKERGVISFPQSRAWMAIRIVHPMPPNVMTLSAAIDAATEKKP